MAYAPKVVSFLKICRQDIVDLPDVTMEAASPASFSFSLI
jgi:hypothetical protein